MYTSNSTLAAIQKAHRDMIDVRNVLSKRMLNKPKDNEGTECTIGMCLDDTIDTLSELEEMAEEDAVFDCTEKNAIMEAAWFAMRHHFKGLAEYLDLSDEYLGQLKAKMDKHLNE
jgi:hypothetical protein